MLPLEDSAYEVLGSTKLSDLYNRFRCEMDYWGVEDVSNNIPMGGLGLQEDTYRQAQVSSGRNFFNQYLMT